MKRESISKKLRFDIFKRDAFICQYCGKTPPLVVLEIDHIHPVSKGGKNGADNLITACFDCNRGKSDGLLSVAPASVAEKAEVIAEREAQIKAFNKVIAAKRKREDSQLAEIEGVYQETFKNYSWQTIFKESVRSNFLPFLTQGQLIAAISKSCSKCSDHESSLKYFCGICWSVRREADGAK